jgi:hypothetical protein
MRRRLGGILDVRGRVRRRSVDRALGRFIAHAKNPVPAPTTRSRPLRVRPGGRRGRGRAALEPHRAAGAEEISARARRASLDTA